MCTVKAKKQAYFAILEYRQLRPRRRREANIRMDLTEEHCESGRWMELA
jgi:hypothetical protein